MDTRATPVVLTTEQKLEQFYLKIFRYGIIGLMSLALCALVIVVPTAIFNYLASPGAPAPEKTLPPKAITTNELLQILIDEEKKRIADEAKGKEGAAKPPSEPMAKPTDIQKYTVNEGKIFQCSIAFASATGQEVSRDEKENAAAREGRRQAIERLAASPLRGEAWVNSLSDFVCAFVVAPEVITAKKESKIGAVIGRIISLHANAWAKNEQEKFDFSRAEKQRIAEHIASEKMRVAIAEAKGIKYFIISSIAFGLFFMLALYLIFAKIEINLAIIGNNTKKS